MAAAVVESLDGRETALTSAGRLFQAYAHLELVSTYPASVCPGPGSHWVVLACVPLVGSARRGHGALAACLGRKPGPVDSDRTLHMGLEKAVN